MKHVARIALWGGVLLLGTEALLRWGIGLGDPPRVVLDPVVEYRLEPSVEYHRFGNRIAINSHGMRGPEHPARRTLGERRVLVIGDSVVYGGHFLDQSDTIGVRLTEKMTAQGCKVRAMAAAASSWGPVNQAAFLKDVGLLDAELGLLIVSAHDLYDVPGSASLIPYRTSAPFGALQDAAQVAWKRLMARIRPQPHENTPNETRAQSTRTALDQVHRQFVEAGAGLVLVYHPTILERNTGVRAERAAFSDWAKAHGVPFFDLSYLSLSQTHYKDTIHPNAMGTEVLATALVDLALSELGPCS